MPDPEFDLYVSLLARLLRLSNEQKQQIEHEFRDHFEERLADLQRQGVPRDAAVRRAIDEFGDAAGLARELTQLSRRTLRRSIMRYTIATAALGAVILLTVNAFIPEHAGIPAPADAQAQQAAEAAPDIGAEDEPAATAAVPEVVWIDPTEFVPEPMARPVDLDAVETPLDEVLHQVAGQIDVPVLLDVQALVDQGLTLDTPVTARAEQESAILVLDRILERVGGVPLAWFLEDDILQITTKEIADETLLTIPYDVTDLLRHGYSRESLVEALQNQTAGPWFDLDGIGGTISEFGDLLTIRQTHAIHREVATLLEALRNRGLERRMISRESDRRMAELLSCTLAVEYIETPLEDVIADINERCGATIRLDPHSLGDQGIALDHPVTITLPERPLRVVLECIFKYVPGLDCKVVWRHGELVVVTQEVASEELETVVYEVSDIVQGDIDGSAALVAVIQNETAGPWFDLDGIGGTISTPVPDIFVVRQTTAVHEGIQQIISVQRSAAARSTDSAGALALERQKPEVRYYRLDAETAEDLLESLPKLVAPGTWGSTVTANGNEVQLSQDGIGSIRKISSGRRVLHVTHKTTEGSTAAVSELLVIPQATLVISHTRSAHRDIQSELRRIVSQQPGDFVTDDPGMGFFGGGGFGGSGGGFF